MLRGEICLVDLDPVRGSGATKRRPAVLVSNDRANTMAQRRGRGVVTVVPVTSNVERVFPFQVLLPAARQDCGWTPKPRPSRCARSPLSGSVLP